MFIPRASNAEVVKKAAEQRAAVNHVTTMLRDRVTEHCVNAAAIQLMVTEIGMV